MSGCSALSSWSENERRHQFNLETLYAQYERLDRENNGQDVEIDIFTMRVVPGTERNGGVDLSRPFGVDSPIATLMPEEETSNTCESDDAAGIAQKPKKKRGLPMLGRSRKRRTVTVKTEPSPSRSFKYTARMPTEEDILKARRVTGLHYTLDHIKKGVINTPESSSAGFTDCRGCSGNFEECISSCGSPALATTCTIASVDQTNSFRDYHDTPALDEDENISIKSGFLNGRRSVFPPPKLTKPPRRLSLNQLSTSRLSSSVIGPSNTRDVVPWTRPVVIGPSNTRGVVPWTRPAVIGPSNTRDVVPWTRPAVIGPSNTRDVVPWTRPVVYNRYNDEQRLGLNNLDKDLLERTVRRSSRHIANSLSGATAGSVLICERFRGRAADYERLKRNSFKITPGIFQDNFQYEMTAKRIFQDSSKEYFHLNEETLSMKSGYMPSIVQHNTSQIVPSKFYQCTELKQVMAKKGRKRKHPDNLKEVCGLFDSLSPRYLIEPSKKRKPTEQMVETIVQKKRKGDVIEMICENVPPRDVDWLMNWVTESTKRTRSGSFHKCKLVESLTKSTVAYERVQKSRRRATKPMLMYN